MIINYMYQLQSSFSPTHVKMAHYNALNTCVSNGVLYMYINILNNNAMSDLQNQINMIKICSTTVNMKIFKINQILLSNCCTLLKD